MFIRKQLLICDSGKTKGNTLRLYLKKYKPKGILLKVSKNLTVNSLRGLSKKGFKTVLIPESRAQEMAEQIKKHRNKVNAYEKLFTIRYSL